eukprot:m.108961 g.108961  ORF g.108961 m.108961 type:complete len:583 (+) comp15228_c1_seq1:176-1924(+)
MSMRKRQPVYIALDDYIANAKTELSFNKGAMLKLLKTPKPDETWWMAQNIETKKKGYIPADLVAIEGSLQLYDWCHGAISRNGAQYLLKEHNVDGMYLVRESQSQPGQYTLDVWKDEKAIHYRIMNGEDGYFFRQGVAFPSIPELIAHHQERPDGLCTRLHTIAPKAHAKTVVIGMDLDRKWELKRDDIKLMEKLGGGNYGEVFKGKFGKQIVAVKTIKEESMETVEFMKEAHVMKKLLHPNLVKLIGVCSQSLPMYIIQEFVPHGDLLSFLRRPDSRKTIDETAQLYIAFQVADGMSCLEAQNTIHRDLAARNCLVGDNLVIKIADFGMGRVVDDLYTARTGTKMPIKWTSPEALCYDAFSIKSDVWSFGVLLWEIATFGDVPYPDMEARDVIHKLEDGYRMPEPPNCPAGLYQVMGECWEMNAKERPSFAELKLTLEELHNAQKGDSKGRRRSKESMKTSNQDWRQQFESKPKEIDADEKSKVEQAIDMTKEVFSGAQHIFRYANEQTVAPLSGDLMPLCTKLVEHIKSMKSIDKAEIKALSAAVKELSKAKTKLEKVKAACEKIRDLARTMNRALKKMA